MSLHIAAWRSIVQISGNNVPVVAGAPAFQQQVAIGSTSLQSNPITDSPADVLGYMVRLVADENCHIAIGANPTATAAATNGCKLMAGVVEWYGVPAGQRVAVIEGA
jgi:hypothetical protein